MKYIVIANYDDMTGFTVACNGKQLKETSKLYKTIRNIVSTNLKPIIPLKDMLQHEYDFITYVENEAIYIWERKQFYESKKYY